MVLPRHIQPDTQRKRPVTVSHRLSCRFIIARSAHFRPCVGLSGHRQGILINNGIDRIQRHVSFYLLRLHRMIFRFSRRRRCRLRRRFRCCFYPWLKHLDSGKNPLKRPFILPADFPPDNGPAQCIEPVMGKRYIAKGIDRHRGIHGRGNKPYCPGLPVPQLAAFIQPAFLKTLNQFLLFLIRQFIKCFSRIQIRIIHDTDSDLSPVLRDHFHNDSIGDIVCQNSLNICPESLDKRLMFRQIGLCQYCFRFTLHGIAESFIRKDVRRR